VELSELAARKSQNSETLNGLLLETSPIIIWKLLVRIRTLNIPNLAGGPPLDPMRHPGWPSIRAKALSRDTSLPQCFPAPLGSQSGGGPKL
jgi:hypothetical protein